MLQRGLQTATATASSNPNASRNSVVVLSDEDEDDEDDNFYDAPESRKSVAPESMDYDGHKADVQTKASELENTGNDSVIVEDSDENEEYSPR